MFICNASIEERLKIAKMSSSVDTEKNFKLEILCKNIQSIEKSQRISALKELLKIVSDQTDEDDLRQLLDQVYLHLVKCYTDRFESIRSLSISIVCEFLQKFSTRNEYFLEYIIPTIRRRIGLPEMHEDSEEMQLQLLEQVWEIVEKFQSKDEDLLMRAYNDIMDILIRNLANQYPNAHRQCCKVIQLLATSTPSFYVRAESLVDPLTDLLSHRQSATRAIAVETLGNNSILCFLLSTFSLNLFLNCTTFALFSARFKACFR